MVDTTHGCSRGSWDLSTFQYAALQGDRLLRVSLVAHIFSHGHKGRLDLESFREQCKGGQQPQVEARRDPRELEKSPDLEPRACRTNMETALKTLLLDMNPVHVHHWASQCEMGASHKSGTPKWWFVG